MLAILRHGGGANAEVYPSEGIALRARVKATKPQLASMSGISIRAIDAAMGELQQQSFLVVSEALKRSAARSWSVPYESPQRAKFAGQNVQTTDRPATVARSSDSSRAQAIGGGDDYHQIQTNPEGFDPSPPSFSQVTREQLLRVLRVIGFERAGTVLSSYGPEKVLGALAMVYDEMLATDVANPGGYLVTTLRKWPAFEPVTDASFLELMEDPEAMAAERRRRKYTESRFVAIGARE